MQSDIDRTRGVSCHEKRRAPPRGTLLILQHGDRAANYGIKTRSITCITPFDWRTFTMPMFAPPPLASTIMRLSPFFLIVIQPPCTVLNLAMPLPLLTASQRALESRLPGTTW